MASIAGMATGTVFNLTQNRVKISVTGRSLAARSSVETELDDEVLTSALNRGEVVLLSTKQETPAPKQEEPVAVSEPEPIVQAEPEPEPQAEEQVETEIVEAEETNPSAEESSEADGEEPKIKKSTKSKVAKEN